MTSDPRRSSQLRRALSEASGSSRSGSAVRLGAARQESAPVEAPRSAASITLPPSTAVPVASGPDES